MTRNAPRCGMQACLRSCCVALTPIPCCRSLLLQRLAAGHCAVELRAVGGAAGTEVGGGAGPRRPPARFVADAWGGCGSGVLRGMHVGGRLARHGPGCLHAHQLPSCYVPVRAGEEVVTRESFISIAWRLVPYWMNQVRYSPCGGTARCGPTCCRDVAPRCCSQPLAGRRLIGPHLTYSPTHPPTHWPCSGSSSGAPSAPPCFLSCPTLPWSCWWCCPACRRARPQCRMLLQLHALGQLLLSWRRDPDCVCTPHG